MNKDIFKYGPPVNMIIAQTPSRNLTYNVEQTQSFLNSGISVLNNGNVIVDNTSILPSSIILLTKQTLIYPSAIIGISNKNPGVGFTISSSEVLDTDVVGYLII